MKIDARQLNTKLLGEDIYYTNFTYDPTCYYFFYIGELKAYGLNQFVREALQKMAPGREVRFVAIIPDVCVQYYYRDIIVINPCCETGGQLPQVCCRQGTGKFMTSVSGSETIRRLVADILENQEELYLSMFESVLEMTLDEIDRVSILGPDKFIAKHYNSKLVQSVELAGYVPLVDSEVCMGLTTLLEKTDALRSTWEDGIFISLAYSAAGINSAVTHTREEVLRRFTDENGEYLITRYISHDLDPTVLAVVANDNDVYIAGIADQKIVGGNKFVGSSYPSKVTKDQADILIRYTISAGRKLGRAGYRGIFGCDYIIDHYGVIWFLEVNARKQGTTLEFCCTLEQNLPAGSPTLPELECHAVLHDCFPPGTVAPKGNFCNLHWETYNHKLAVPVLTTGYIPQHTGERSSFAKVAKKEIQKDFVILEHLGSPLKVMPGTFLARVVSVARSGKDVREGLDQGIGWIKQTFQEV